MGRFADAEIGTLSEEELAEFERLIEVPDADLYGWISGEAEVPANYDTGLFRRLEALPPARGAASTAEPSAPSKGLASRRRRPASTASHYRP